MGDERSTDAADLPLHGITVVALEQAVAAPLATRHLADLGARVLKIERVGSGDFARHYDASVHGLAAHFVWLNRGKESIAVDLRSPDGIEVVRALIARADVVIQNLAPHAAERLGLASDELRAADPRLVTVDMSGYGTAGPFVRRKAYDMLVQAETGLCSITGTPDSATKTGIPTSDIAAGMYALTAVQAALFRRERTGVGAHVDVSMFDATAEWLGYPMYLQMYQDRQIPRMGLSHSSIAPYDAYPTADGEILIGVQNERGWQALATAVFERPEWVTDERFSTNIARVRNRAEVDAMVADETRRFTSAELDDRLARAGVPAGRLNDMRGLIDHPQLAERDRWREVGTESGPVRGVLPPMTFADVELPMGDVPPLGRDTDALLTECGYDADRIATLRASGAVG